MGGKRVGDYLLSAPKRLLVAFAFTFAIAASSVDAASGDYPADPSADVPWLSSEWAPADIQTIMNKFNAARAQDPTISVDLVIEYTQDQWDALSDNEKGLYLSNKERIDRGIAPYAAVARQVSDVAEDYAAYMEDEQTIAHVTTQARWTGSGRSSSSCCDPTDRLAAALGSQKEFFTYSKNIAWTSVGSTLGFPEPIAWSLYSFIYDDSGPAWGHRHFSLAELSDNAGDAGAEGLAGFGVARGSSGTYVVMNVADEAPGWDYTTADNLILWSSMVGGNSSASFPASPAPLLLLLLLLLLLSSFSSFSSSSSSPPSPPSPPLLLLLLLLPLASGDPPSSNLSPSTSAIEEIEEALEDIKETGNGGLLAAIVIFFGTLLIGFAMWQHALYDPEGGSARVFKAIVGAERFRAAYEAPRSWRRCSCLIPPAPAEEEPQRGFFGLFRGGKDAEKDKAKQARGGVDVERGDERGRRRRALRAVSRRQRRRKGQGETGARRRALRAVSRRQRRDKAKQARGGVDVEKGETKEAGGGGLFGLFRGGKDAEKDKAKEARGGGLFGCARRRQRRLKGQGLKSRGGGLFGRARCVVVA